MFRNFLFPPFLRPPSHHVDLDSVAVISLAQQQVSSRPRLFRLSVSGSQRCKSQHTTLVLSSAPPTTHHYARHRPLRCLTTKHEYRLRLTSTALYGCLKIDLLVGVALVWIGIDDRTQPKPRRLTTAAMAAHTVRRMTGSMRLLLP